MYCGNNPLVRIDPTGESWDDVKKAVSNAWNTVKSWFSGGSGSSNSGGSSNDAKASSPSDLHIELPNEYRNETRSTFDSLGNDPELQELKFKFLMGEITYDDLEKLGVKYSNFSNAELDIFASHAKNLEKLYKADIVSKEQYEREWERLGEKGYLYDYAFGNIKASGDELYLVGGIALYRSVQMVGSAFISSQLFQKVVSEDPVVAETVIINSPNTNILNVDMFKNLQTLVQDQRAWSNFQTYMQEWANRESVRQSADKAYDAFLVYLELLKKGWK